MRDTAIRSRAGRARVALVAFLLALGFAIPVGTADAAPTAATRIVGFDTTLAYVVLDDPDPSISDAVRVRTGSGFTARKVQVQSRFLGFFEPPAGQPRPAWKVESTAVTDSLGRVTVKLKPASFGLWEYRLRVVPTSDAAAAVTAVKKVQGDYRTVPQ